MPKPFIPKHEFVNYKFKVSFKKLVFITVCLIKDICYDRFLLYTRWGLSIHMLFDIIPDVIDA